MQETNFVMCSMILFLNSQDYQQDLCDWVFVKLRRNKGGMPPWISVTQNSGHYCKRNRRMTKES